MGQLTTKPLVFHEVHGDYIELSESKTVAKCARIGDDSLLFSRYQIKMNQKIYIKVITSMKQKSHDIISLGFTSQDPSTLCRQLPECDSYELENKSKYWLCTLSKHFCVSEAILCFYYDEFGELHYGLHEKRKYTKLGSKIKQNPPLWAVLRLWSAPVIVALSNSATSLSSYDLSVFNDNNNYSFFDSDLVRSDELLVRKDVKVSTVYQHDDSMMCTICFDSICDTALYPCGHLCMCEKCAKKQWGEHENGHCPVCRAAIFELLRIYK